MEGRGCCRWMLYRNPVNDHSKFTSRKIEANHISFIHQNPSDPQPIFFCLWYFNDLSVYAKGKYALPSQAQFSMSMVVPLIYHWSSSHFLPWQHLCHQALHPHQPWKSLITQNDNIKTIKPTYISKTASLLSLLQVIKICHSTHKSPKDRTWWVVLRRPLLRPKPFFTQGPCQ